MNKLQVNSVNSMQFKQMILSSQNKDSNIYIKFIKFNIPIGIFKTYVDQWKFSIHPLWPQTYKWCTVRYRECTLTVSWMKYIEVPQEQNHIGVHQLHLVLASDSLKSSKWNSGISTWITVNCHKKYSSKKKTEHSLAC